MDKHDPENKDCTLYPNLTPAGVWQCTCPPAHAEAIKHIRNSAFQMNLTDQTLSFQLEAAADELEKL